MNLMTKKICANVCAAVMSITAVGICGELLLDNKSVGAEKAGKDHKEKGFSQ